MSLTMGNQGVTLVSSLETNSLLLLCLLYTWLSFPPLRKWPYLCPPSWVSRLFQWCRSLSLATWGGCLSNRLLLTCRKRLVIVTVVHPWFLCCHLALIRWRLFSSLPMTRWVVGHYDAINIVLHWPEALKLRPTVPNSLFYKWLQDCWEVFK